MIHSSLKKKLRRFILLFSFSIMMRGGSFKTLNKFLFYILLFESVSAVCATRIE